MRVRYWLLLILVGIPLGILSVFYIMAYIAITPDPDYNTVYTNDYKENRFEAIKLGVSKAEVLRALGEPFEIYSAKYKHKILYSKYNVGIDHGAGISINDTVAYSKLKWLICDFDSLGNVLKIQNRNYLNENVLLQFKRLNYTKILDTLGSPKQEVLCDCKGEVYDYAKLKEGPYRGKIGYTYIRRLLFRDDVLFQKISGESTFNKYYKLCEKE